MKWTRFKLACFLGVLALLAGSMHAYRVHLKCTRIIAGLNNDSLSFELTTAGYYLDFGEWRDEFTYLESHPFMAKPLLLRKLADTNAFIAAHVALTVGAYSDGWSNYPDWNNYLPGASNQVEQSTYLNQLWKSDGKPFRSNPVYKDAYFSSLEERLSRGF